MRAIRKGWLKVGKQKRRGEQQPVYLLWGDDDQVGVRPAQGPGEQRARAAAVAAVDCAAPG